MQMEGLDLAALAVLAITSVCQELAFGGAGQNGFLSNGVPEPHFQEFFDVRLD